MLSLAIGSCSQYEHNADMQPLSALGVALLLHRTSTTLFCLIGDVVLCLLLASRLSLTQVQDVQVGSLALLCSLHRLPSLLKAFDFRSVLPLFLS
jgi:hypothetical protein